MSEQPKENKLIHPSFPQPQDLNVKVWRYMDTSKFIDILTRKCLYLSRLDLLGDPHEGSISKINLEARQQYFAKYGLTDSSTFMEDKAKQNNNGMFVNCWYYNNYESEAMWRLYCPNNKGVAIQTTYKKLIESISYDDSIYVGLVNYIDYESEWLPDGNIYSPVMHKRKAFEYENEIRLVKWNIDHIKDKKMEPYLGLHINWDLEKFIENIYVNPYSQNWYYEVIKSILEKFGFDVNLNWSMIKTSPYY